MKQGGTIEIKCPVCGRRQTVARWMWEFSQGIAPGQRPMERGHPYTCGGRDCPSHTEMVPVEEV